MERLGRFRLSALSGLQIFQICRFGGFLLTGICFAKLGVARSEIGRFETFLWISGLFSFFWITGIMNATLARYSKTEKEEQQTLLLQVFLLIFLISLLCGAVLFVLPVSEKPYLYLLFNNPSYVIEFLLFLQQRNRSLVIYGVVTAMLQVLLCVVPAAMGCSMWWIFAALSGLAFLKFLLAIWLLLKGRTSKVHVGQMFQHLQIAFPLMLSFLISGSAEYIDGAIMKAQFSLAQFSVFRYGSREFPLFTILAATLSTSFIPAVAADQEKGLQLIRERSLRYMHWFFPMAILMIWLSRPAFSFFFSPQFETSGLIFAALLLLTAPRLLFPQAIFTALQKNRVLLVVSIAEMLVNVIASWYLASWFGMIGVAYGTVVAFAFEKVVLVGWLHFKERISPASYIPIYPFLWYTLLLFASFWAVISL